MGGGGFAGAGAVGGGGNVVRGRPEVGYPSWVSSLSGLCSRVIGAHLREFEYFQLFPAYKEPAVEGLRAAVGRCHVVA